MIPVTRCRPNGSRSSGSPGARAACARRSSSPGRASTSNRSTCTATRPRWRNCGAWARAACRWWPAAGASSTRRRYRTWSASSTCRSGSPSDCRRSRWWRSSTWFFPPQCATSDSSPRHASRCRSAIATDRSACWRITCSAFRRRFSKSCRRARSTTTAS